MEIFWKNETLKVKIVKYPNGNNAIFILDEYGIPYAKASVNPDVILESDEVAIKNWSENKGILDVLVNAKIISEPYRVIQCGYEAAHICKLLTDKEG